MFQAQCSVCVLSAGFIASDWVWLHEPMVGHLGRRLDFGDRWVCPKYAVTFEPSQVALGAWQEVKDEAMSGVAKVLKVMGQYLNIKNTSGPF